MMNVSGTRQHGLHSVLFSPVILRRVALIYSVSDSSLTAELADS